MPGACTIPMPDDASIDTTSGFETDQVIGASIEGIVLPDESHATQGSYSRFKLVKL